MEQEQANRRKDIIKNILIIFLIIMLLLTFFSNTILNYSLPQVSAVYATQATISEQIRGSGSVQPAQTYEVKINEDREVKSVLVRVGDTIKAGDTIAILEDVDNSTAVQEARDKLADLELDYRKALLDSNSTSYSSDILAIERAEQELEKLKKQREEAVKYEADSKTAAADVRTATADVDKLKAEKEKYNTMLSSASTEDMLDLTDAHYKKIQAAKQAVTNAEKAFADAQAAYKKFSSGIDTTDIDSTLIAKRNEADKLRTENNNLYTKIANAEAGADTSSYSETIANNITTINNLNREISNLMHKQSLTAGDKKKLEDLEKAQEKAEKAVTDAKDAQAQAIREVKLEIKGWIDDVDRRLEAANGKLTDVTNRKDDIAGQGISKVSDIDSKIESQEASIQKLKDDLHNKQITDSTAASKTQLDLESKKNAVDRQQRALDKLLAGTDKEIVSKSGGVVASINISAGSKAEAGKVVATVNVTDLGYLIEMPVKAEQAKKIRVGDIAEVVSWYGSNISATVKEIKADSNNPQSQKILVFEITGDDITVGQNLTLQMGSKGQQYSVTVPNNAIREDSNGKYVLVMESKSSPLGNRYKAARYPVEVLAKDEKNSAVSGLSGNEFVITTSTKPINAGAQVRPAED
ncbi:MAG: biotin/lipoyl-binding protein [Oscillospiraceae bacterium]|nr:biotin/lipoyl-binding protein [Oscillospiraceae bacterium]